MSTQIQYRRGTSTEHQSFTGAVGEITIDTTLNSIRVHDGSTLGGVLISRAQDTVASFTHANSAYDKANSAYNHANTKFASAGGTISGDVTVTGNLTVTGYQVYANTTVALIQDNIVTLNASIGQSSTPTSNAGIEIDRGSLANVQLLWNESSDKWTFTNDGTIYDDIAAAGRLDSAYGHANSAYDKANSGYDQANTGTTHAAAAFTHANSAYGHANGAFTHANSAYSKANSGYDQANTATAHAVGAFTHANSAYGHANAAFTHANSAYDKANSGYTQANTGTAHAVSAYDKANSGYSQANTALTHASSAYDKANSGYNQANTGTTHASSAYDKANSGYNQANTGTTHAQGAFTQANSAYDKANSAYNTANTKFASAGGTISGDVTVTGNLFVSGTTVTVSANNLSIKDNMIYLNDGANSAYPDLGLAGAYNNGTYQHTGVFRDQTDSYWKFFDGYLPEPDASVYIDTSNNSFRLAPIWVSEAKANNLTANYSALGTVTTGTWQGSSISTTYTDAKITSVGGQTGAISNTQLLNFLSSVDGTGSGLDADLLDGQDSTYYTNASSISSGTLGSARLPTSGVSAGTYGSAAIIPVFAVDTYGRITSVTNTTVAITSSQVSGLATSATTDTSNATNITSGTLNSARLPTSGVAAGTYASAAIVPVFTVDATGRITAVTNTSIAITSGQVSGLATSATTDTTNATNISSGTLNASRLPTSGVTAGTYASAAIVPVFTVDATGRITAVTNTSIAISSSAVSGLATSATTDTTNASNITSGTLALGRLPTTNIANTGTFTASTITVDSYGRVTAAANGTSGGVSAAKLYYFASF